MINLDLSKHEIGLLLIGIKDSIEITEKLLLKALKAENTRDYQGLSENRRELWEIESRLIAAYNA